MPNLAAALWVRISGRDFLSGRPQSCPSLAPGVFREAPFGFFGSVRDGCFGNQFFVDRENLCFAKYHRTLDDVPAARGCFPAKDRTEAFERLPVDSLYVLASFSRIAIDKVFHQQRNVRPSFSKRRYLDREDIQPVKTIATERPSADSGLQVTVRGGDYPNVSVDSTSAADTLKTHAPAKHAGGQFGSRLEVLPLRPGRAYRHLLIQTYPSAAEWRP